MSVIVCEFTPPCLYAKPATSKGSIYIYRHIYVCIGIEIFSRVGIGIGTPPVCLSVNAIQAMLDKALAFRQRCLWRLYASKPFAGDSNG